MEPLPKDIPPSIDRLLKRYKQGGIDYATQRDRLKRLGDRNPALRSFIDTYLRWTQLPGNNEVEWLA
jgi:hypothetical protein